MLLSSKRSPKLIYVKANMSESTLDAKLTIHQRQESTYQLGDSSPSRRGCAETCSERDKFGRPFRRHFMCGVTNAACAGAFVWWGCCAVVNALYIACSASGSEGTPRVAIARDVVVHNVIYYVILPPLIFEAGFTLRKRSFFANFGTIIAYATIGTTVAVVVTALILIGVVQTGLISTDYTAPQLLLWSSLISSTDPIATLSILSATNAKPPLHDLIFGESALNDALSIVLFNVFLSLVHQSAHDQHPPFLAIVKHVAIELSYLLPTSIALGSLIGLASALVTRRLSLARAQRPHVELALIIFFALLCYSLVDFLDFSPILAIFFCAITTRHYSFYNLSDAAQGSATILFQTIASISEAALALLLGIAIVDYIPEVWAWDPLFTTIAILATLIARAAAVFPISRVANRFRKKGKQGLISNEMQVVVWFSGMRGGISFALAMTLDDSTTASTVIPTSVAARLVTTTLMTIVFTNFVMAPLTAPLIHHLRLALDHKASVSTAHDDQEDSHLTTRSSANHQAELSSALLSADDNETPAYQPLAETLAPHEQPTAQHLPAQNRPPGNLAPHQPAGPNLPLDLTQGLLREPKPPTGVHRLWRVVDEQFMKPLFGGKPRYRRVHAPADLPSPNAPPTDTAPH